MHPGGSFFIVDLALELALKSPFSSTQSHLKWISNKLVGGQVFMSDGCEVRSYKNNSPSPLEDVVQHDPPFQPQRLLRGTLKLLSMSFFWEHPKSHVWSSPMLSRYLILLLTSGFDFFFFFFLNRRKEPPVMAFWKFLQKEKKPPILVI